VTADPFPYGPYCEDYSNHPYDFYTWIYSDDNIVNFELVYTLEDAFQWAGTWTYRYPVPLVYPEITLSSIEDCHVANVSQKCSTTIGWDDLYFAPDAGIYYRLTPNSNWNLLRRISDRNGSYTTTDLIGVDGVEIVVFQYSRHIKGRDRNGNANGGVTYISAPDGIMAGPISVKAIAADTTPVPVIESVGEISTNNYKVELLGYDFGSNPTVSVRANEAGSSVFAVYTSDYFHAQGTHASSHAHAGKDFIRFPFIKVDRQNIFTNKGVCFTVNNGTHDSQAEQCYQRIPSNPQPQFMGEYLQSYNHTNSLQDIDSDAYIVKADGSLVKIWGNSWKKIPFNYTVTSNTQVEFDFASTLSEGEITGIGFIMNGQSNVTAAKFWQLHGNQGNGWGNQEHHNYSGTAYKNYTIKIGETFTGQISHIVFAADYDNQRAGQNVVFRPPLLSEDIPGVDAYDDVPAQTAHDDDEKERAIGWGNNTDYKLHTFHDAGDTDWTLVWANEFRVRTELVGSNADTKLSVYKWNSFNVNNTTGFFENINDELLGIDVSSGASEFSVYGTEYETYAIKVESKNNVLGDNSQYKLLIEAAPPFAPDQYDDVPHQRAFDDDATGKGKFYSSATANTIHNFHDFGDIDWTILWAEDFTVNTALLGANAQNQVEVYKWQAATWSPTLGYYINVTDTLIGQSSNTQNESITVWGTEHDSYGIKVSSLDNSYGTGTDYKLVIESPSQGQADIYENSTGVSGYTNDTWVTPSPWGNHQSEQIHNFHDNNDVDWILVWAPGFIANATTIGEDADLKMTVYKWISASQYPSGVFYNIQSQQVGQDHSSGSSVVNIPNTSQYATYVIKLESGDGSYGNGTGYKLRLY